MFSLTARDQEVLALLAERVTDTALTDVLFISKRTANRHVSSIFSKLGVYTAPGRARCGGYRTGRLNVAGGAAMSGPAGGGVLVTSGTRTIFAPER